MTKSSFFQIFGIKSNRILRFWYLKKLKILKKLTPFSEHPLETEDQDDAQRRWLVSSSHQFLMCRHIVIHMLDGSVHPMCPAAFRRTFERKCSPQVITHSSMSLRTHLKKQNKFELAVTPRCEIYCAICFSFTHDILVVPW